MRRTLACLAAAVAALAPSTADAAGFFLGARLGAAFPGGDVAADQKVGDLVDWAVPVQLEIGGSGKQLTLAGYLRFAPGILDSAVKSGCEADGATCSASDIGLGAEVLWHFSPGRAGPWLGGFGGWEWFRYDYALLGDKYAVTDSGWELGAQGGIDFAWGILTLGPYGAIALGEFGKATAEVNGQSDTRSISGKRTHTWWHLGVRTAFQF